MMRRLFVATVVLLPGVLSVAWVQGGAAEEALAVLRSDGALEAKVEACRVLSRAGGPEAVPVLAALLADEKLGDMARYALEGMPGGRVDEVLREALGTLEGRALAGVVASLGMRRDALAIPPLTALVHDGDTAAAQAAAGALGRIGTPAAHDALLRALAAGRADVRAAVADACLHGAQQALDRGIRHEALRLFDAVRQSDVAEHRELAAVRGAVLAREAEGVPMFVALLRSGDDARRQLALRLAREMSEAAVGADLAAALQALPVHTQVHVIGVLAERRDSASRQAIHHAVVEGAPEVRAAGLRALALCGDARSIEVLLGAVVPEGPPEAREAAAASLRAIDVPGADRTLAEKLASAPPFVRVEILGVLADRGSPDVAPLVLGQAASADPEVARAAFAALGRLAGADELPAVVQHLLSCPHADVTDVGVKAVALMAKRGPDVSRRGDVVAAALAATGDSRERRILLQVLAQIGNAQGFEALCAALSDAHADVRDAAVRGLASWPDATPTQQLLGVARTTADSVHRALALRAVIRMVGLVATDCLVPSGQVIDWFREVDGLAASESERKLLLSGLAQAPHGTTLELAMRYLTDDGIRREAALAAIEVARGLGTMGERAVARDALERIRALDASEAVQEAVRAALTTLAQDAEYIVDWQVCGTFSRRGMQCQQVYDVAFPPETGADEVQWHLLRAPTGREGRMVLVHPVLSGSHCVAYVRTWLLSDRAREGRLEMGFDDGGKVWLNGEVVCEANTAGACVLGAHAADITLRQGRNLLFLKLTQHSGPWQFAVRLVGRDGKPMEGVRVVLEPDDASTVAEAAADGPDIPDADVARIPAQALFDGRTLAGWEGSETCFAVRDGAIVAGQLHSPIEVSDYLVTTREFADFELTAQVRTVGQRVNGGIQFRGRRVPNSHAMTGYQADVCDGAYWGCLYDCARGGFAVRIPQDELAHVLRPGDWNDVRIRAVGRRIQVWLNGYRTVDFAETRPGSPTSGAVGLQTHKGPPGEGWYRRIAIKVLAPAAP